MDLRRLKEPTEAVTLSTDMNMEESNKETWDLLITPRKKWYDLRLPLPSPGGGMKGEGVFLFPTCPNEVSLDNLPESRGQR
jgi:hypothetical protein